MKTMKAFCEKSHIDSRLIRATVRQIGGWESFQSYANDVVNHGAMGGFCGFTYYSDTVAFTKRHKAAIFDLCEEQRKEIGDTADIISFVASFNCLKDEEREDITAAFINPKADKTQVYNALAWFTLEEVCRSYCDLKDSE